MSQSFDNQKAQLTSNEASDTNLLAGVFSEWKSGHYEFVLEAETRCRVPENTGGTLRGGFGYLFKETVCTFPDPLKQNCADCVRRAACAYPYIFETQAGDGGQQAVHLDDAPRPFVLQPPIDRKTAYESGDRLTFGLVLIGRAIAYLPFFVTIFERLGQRGLGQTGARFCLVEVAEHHPLTRERRVIYSTRSNQIAAGKIVMDFAAASAWAQRQPPGELTLRFVTPTRLIRDNVIVERPDFHTVYRRVLRRLAALYSQNCGHYLWEEAVSELVEQARDVRTERIAVRWDGWRRVSTRQQRGVTLSGIVGEAAFIGALAPFLPTLLLGSLVHVGKAATFGNGRYLVNPSEKEQL